MIPKEIILQNIQYVFKHYNLKYVINTNVRIDANFYFEKFTYLCE